GDDVAGEGALIAGRRIGILRIAGIGILRIAGVAGHARRVGRDGLHVGSARVAGSGLGLGSQRSVAVAACHHERQDEAAHRTLPGKSIHGVYSHSLTSVNSPKNRILAAAAKVFARTGTACTVEDLLEAADVSRRTFYQSFGNKEEVLAALYQNACQIVL